MSKVTHLHTYVRTKIDDWFMCAHPNCRHRERLEFLIGKLAQCTCGASFTLTKLALKRKWPTCIDCVQSKRNKRSREIETSNQNSLKSAITEIIEDLQ